MSNQNTKKSPGIEVAFFKCTGDMIMDNFDYLNTSLSLFSFYFVTNLRKKNYGVRTLTAQSPAPPIRASTFVAGPPLSPSKRSYYMDDPIHRSSEEYLNQHQN